MTSPHDENLIYQPLPTQRKGLTQTPYRQIKSIGREKYPDTKDVENLSKNSYLSQEFQTQLPSLSQELEQSYLYQVTNRTRERG